MSARRLAPALVVSLFALLLPGAPRAEEKSGKVKIAVLNVRALGNVVKKTGKDNSTIEVMKTSDGGEIALSGIATLVTAQLAKDPKLDVISSKDIESMVGFERQKELLGCGDASCLVEIGGALGRDYLVASEIAEVGSTYLLSMSLVSVTKAKAAGRLTKRVQFVAQVADTMTAATQELLELARKRELEDPRKRDKKVAILDVKAGGIEANKVQGLASLVASEVAGRADTLVTTGEDIRALIGFERQRTALGCEEASCLAEIGGALGVDFIITTEVSKIGDEWVLALSMVDIKKAQATNRTAARVRRAELLVDHTISGVKELFFELNVDTNKSTGRYIQKTETNVWGWSLLTTGVVVAGTGTVVLNALAVPRNAEANATGLEPEEQNTIQNEAVTLLAIGFTLVGAGGATAIIGALDLLLHGSSAERLEFIPTSGADVPAAGASLRIPLP